MKEKQRRLVGFLIPRLDDLIFIALFFGVLASGAQMLGIDSDLGRHLALGSYILEQRVVPTHDLFSDTLPGLPRPPYEWLSQLIFALSYRLLNLDGVILVTAILIGGTFALIFHIANRRSQSPLISLTITLIAAGASSLHWLPRPHIITLLFMAIWVDRLERLRKGGKISLFIFPIIMLFWANLHGGFVFGMLAWLAYLAGWVWDRISMVQRDSAGSKLLIAGSSSLVASIITPDLWHNWDAVLGNRSSYILSRTAETMRPSLADPSVFPFVLLLTLVVMFSIFNWRDLSGCHIILLGGFGLLSILMSRNIPIFAIACAPILTEMIARTMSRSKMWIQFEKRFSRFGSRTPGIILPSIMILLAGLYIANHHSKTQQPIFQFNPRVFPVDAVNWVETHPQRGKMFNEFNWGGYLLFRLWPDYRVFLDSQSDFYGEPLMRDYESLMTATDDWRGLIDRYQITWSIIPVDSGLAHTLASDAGWSTEYRDQTAIILVRK